MLDQIHSRVLAFIEEFACRFSTPLTGSETYLALTRPTPNWSPLFTAFFAKVDFSRCTPLRSKDRPLSIETDHDSAGLLTNRSLGWKSGSRISPRCARTLGLMSHLEHIMENKMPSNAAPQPGDRYLCFDGINDYVEVPNRRCYSIDHTWEFAVAAWLRADTDNFPTPEHQREYVHWLGKGDGNHGEGTQEWVCRMYSLHTPHEYPPRPKRTSFYVFNPEGGLGVGSFVQPTIPVSIGVWRLIVAMADRAHTFLYCDGEYVDCDTYRGPATCGCSIMTHAGAQVVVNPLHGPAPLRIGAQELNKSYFLGGISKVRLWNRLLTAQEIRALYRQDIAPRDSLAGEFLLNEGQGTTANDTAAMNHGEIHGATWATQ